jgi:ribosome maturation factor RimP
MKQRKHPVVVALEPEIERTLDDYGYELVLMKFGGPPTTRTLSIFIDKAGGVTAEDCKYMAERLSIICDMVDPVEGPYRLVVSSPGIDRPLTRDEDFTRFAGSKVSVRFEGANGKRRGVRGLLEGVVEGKAVVLAEGGVREEIALDTIEDGNLIYDWDAEGLAEDEDEDAGKG